MKLVGISSHHPAKHILIRTCQIIPTTCPSRGWPKRPRQMPTPWPVREVLQHINSHELDLIFAGAELNRPIKATEVTAGST